MPTRKKHPRLPNGYGTIRYLGKGRRNAYAVHPPADIDGNRPPAICYVDDWMKGFVILTAFKSGTYSPGMENTLDPSSLRGSSDLSGVVSRLLSDYSRIRKHEPQDTEKTFSDVYTSFFKNKYKSGHTYSLSTINSTRAAYKNCQSLHARPFRELRGDDLQKNIDLAASRLKHSSLELIVNLYHQMYEYADGQNWCDKRYDAFVKIGKPDDDEHGVPFYDEELKILWAHKADPSIELLLILCYSGWRITETSALKTDLKNRYFQGGMKTVAGKDRLVPIHPGILPLVEHRIRTYGCLLPCSIESYRKNLYIALESVGLKGDPKHTPHDARHTFSLLCEKYDVKENDRKRMLGHSFKDVTNKVYGHRDLEDLRTEIEKIKIVL